MAKKRIKTWTVTGRVVGSIYVGTFEAATAEEAIEQAEREASVSLCHHCSRKIEDPEIDRYDAEEVARG